LLRTGKLRLAALHPRLNSRKLDLLRNRRDARMVSRSHELYGLSPVGIGKLGKGTFDLRKEDSRHHNGECYGIEGSWLIHNLSCRI
jgi:hypothetical protein